VAAAAEEHDLTVVHYDADFDLIAAVTGPALPVDHPRASSD
jgi:predicted nucleic acid-binding protein